MKIRVEDLKDKALLLSAEEQVEGYPDLLSLQETGECFFTGPLGIELNIVREFDHIRVSGRVESSLRIACSRCLEEYPLAIDSPFTIFYLKGGALTQDEDVELGEQDLIAATYAGDEIDFTGEISEQVLLAIPFKPLCREDCRGLCPNCGIELNYSQCDCKGENMNIQFSVLSKIKVNN